MSDENTVTASPAVQAVQSVQTEAREPLNIRRLKVKDMKFLSNHFKTAMQNTGNEFLGGIISSKVDQSSTGTESTGTESEGKSVEESVGETVVNISVKILTKSVDYLNGDLAKFFADLLNKTIEEYEEMDIDTPLRVIQHIKTAPEAAVFFTMSSLLSNVTELLEKPLSNLKEKFDSIFAEAKRDS